MVLSSAQVVHGNKESGCSCNLFYLASIGSFVSPVADRRVTGRQRRMDQHLHCCHGASLREFSSPQDCQAI
jgi:hypothetical protein